MSRLSNPEGEYEVTLHDLVVCTDIGLIDFLFLPEDNRYRCLRCTGHDAPRDMYLSAALTHELTGKHRRNAEQHAASLRAADTEDWPMLLAASTSVRAPGPDYPGQAFRSIPRNSVIASMFSGEDDDNYESSTHGMASGPQSSYSPFGLDAFSDHMNQTVPSLPPPVNPQLLVNHIRAATENTIHRFLVDPEIVSEQSHSSSSSEAGDGNVAGGELPGGLVIHTTYHRVRSLRGGAITGAAASVAIIYRRTECLASLGRPPCSYKNRMLCMDLTYCCSHVPSI